MMRKIIKPTILALCLCMSLKAAHGQIIGGVIGGEVKNAGGHPLANATATLRTPATGAVRTIKTDSKGRFSSPALPVGVYDITITRKGYAKAIQSGVKVEIGQAVQLNFILAGTPALLEGGGSKVNVTTRAAAGVVGESEIRDLPFDGRSFSQLISVNPATVTYTAERDGGSGTSSAGVGNQYAVAGRRPQDNLFLLNGVEFTGMASANTQPGGPSGQFLGADAVQAMNVVTDSYSANYGKRDGGQISIVTGSGSNKLRGDIFEYLRNNDLNSRNYFDPGAAPKLERNQFGASLGGPVVPSRLLFFASYEGYRLSAGQTNVAIVPDAKAREGYLPDASGTLKHVGVNAAVVPLLALYPAQNGPELLSNGLLTGLAEAYSHPHQYVSEQFGTVRIDNNIGIKDLLFGVYTVDDGYLNGALQNPISQISQSLREQVASAQEQHVFSSSVLNTAHVGYSRANFSYNAFNNAGPPGWVTGLPIGAILISGSTASNGISQLTLAGNNVAANTWAVRNLLSAEEHVYLTRNGHQIEFGEWIENIQSNDFLAQNQYGLASFATLSTFLQGTVQSFTVVPRPSEMGWRSLENAVFVDDIWKMRPRLELRTGLRVESSNGWNGTHGRASNYTFTNGVIASEPFLGTSPLTENKAKFLFNPRLGFAWDVFGNGHTAVRGGAGLYHSMLDMLDYRLDQTAPFNTASTLKNTTVSKLHVAPGDTIPTGALVTASTVQTNIATPAVIEWRLRIEQLLAQHTTIFVGYAGSHSYHQILSEDDNEPLPSYTSSGQPYYPSGAKCANPNMSKTTSWVSHGVGMYNALETSVRGSIGPSVTLRGSYTFAKNLDDGSAYTSAQSLNSPGYVEFPLDPKLDWGPATSDVRQSATVTGTWALPIGPSHWLLGNTTGAWRAATDSWSMSGSLNTQTGFPFSPQLGFNPTGNGDSRNPVRPNWNTAFRGNLYPHTVTEYFNPNAFSSPAAGYFGNVARDCMVGPGLAQFDLSVAKSVSIEKMRMQLRASAYNVLNHSNFATPNEITYASSTSTASPTGGLITSTSSTSRQLQLSAKLSF